MSYDKMKYSNTKQRRQNLVDARTYFNIDLCKQQSILQDEMYYIGVRWFKKGRSLQVAPKNFLENSSFMYGYENAKRSHDGEIFNLGYQHYINGGNLENIPEEYQENSIFKEGYEKAIQDSCKDKKNTRR